MCTVYCTGLWFSFKLHQLSTITHIRTIIHGYSCLKNGKQEVVNFNNLLRSVQIFTQLFLTVDLIPIHYYINVREYNWEQYVVPAIATSIFVFCLCIVYMNIEHIYIVGIHFWNWILTSWRPPSMIYMMI